MEGVGGRWKQGGTWVRNPESGQRRLGGQKGKEGDERNTVPGGGLEATDGGCEPAIPKNEMFNTKECTAERNWQPKAITNRKPELGFETDKSWGKRARTSGSGGRKSGRGISPKDHPS